MALTEREDVNDAILNGLFETGVSVSPESGSGASHATVTQDAGSYASFSLPPAFNQADFTLSLLIAVLLEMLLPWPKIMKLSGLEKVFSSLAFKVNRPSISAAQRAFAGVLLPALILATLLLPLLVADALSGFDALLHLLVMVFVLELRFPQQKAARLYALLRDRDKAGARRCLDECVLRDTFSLSEMGLAKAGCESVILRAFHGWFAVIVWYLILGIEGAVLMQAVSVMCRAFNRKLNGNRVFGTGVFRMHQLLIIAPALAILPLLMLSRHPLRVFEAGVAGLQQHPAPFTGLVLGAVGASVGCRTGGPRFYQGSKVRHVSLGGDAEPEAISVLDGMRKIRFCGLVLCMIAALVQLNS